MNGSQLLRQVRVIDPLSDRDQVADVLITDGIIQGIESRLEVAPNGVVEIDGYGLILGPGLVDLYSHSGEPGHEERETLKSLMETAAAGGFTRLAILPDTVPCADNPATIASLHKSLQVLSDNSPLLPFPRVQFWANLTLNAEGKQMTELADLASAEIIGFTDNRPLENWGLLRRILEYLKPLKKTIALVPTNLSLRGNGVIREGKASIAFGLPGDSFLSETTTLAALLEMIATYQIPVHLMRISTRRGVELIAQAKAGGLPITASTTWMHLLLSSQAIKSYDPNLRIEPPLGNEEDMLALIEGVKQRTIDAIAVDHTPYTYEEKTVPFAESPPGAIGLELALSLLWQRFVVTEEWSALQLWRALSTNPCHCLGQPPIACEPGTRAELLLFDPQKTWTVSRHHLKTRADNTPWLGKQLTGRVVRVWQNCYG